MSTTTPKLQERLRDCRGLVLDFDGTLAPNLDLPDMRRQVIELTQEHNVPETVYSDAYIVEIVESAQRWLARQDLAQAERYGKLAHTLITGLELSAAAQTSVFPESRELLRCWRKRGGSSAIVTRNCRAAVARTYPEVHREVDVLLARDDVSHLKPDARHLQHALTELRIEPGACLMVGDGRMDMALGKSRGLYCVGVLGGSGERTALLAAGADCVIEHIGALTAALNDL